MAPVSCDVENTRCEKRRYKNTARCDPEKRDSKNSLVHVQGLRYKLNKIGKLAVFSFKNLFRDNLAKQYRFSVRSINFIFAFSVAKHNILLGEMMRRKN